LDSVFWGHARDAVRDHQVPEVSISHVVGDADVVLERGDGRIEYTGTWEGRTFVVILEHDGVTVVTVWEQKQRRPRRR
jgi:hypothetical protein